MTKPSEIGNGHSKVARFLLNWPAISAIAAVAAVIIGALALFYPRADMSPVISSTPTREALLVARISESTVSMPPIRELWFEYCSELQLRVDSILRTLPNEKSDDISDILGRQCSLRIWEAVHVEELDRFTVMELINEGAVTARSVTLRLPMKTGHWQKAGDETQYLPLNRDGDTYTIEIGDLRPGEVLQVSAWSRSLSRDTIAIFQDAGRTRIHRRQRGCACGVHVRTSPRMLLTQSLRCYGPSAIAYL